MSGKRNAYTCEECGGVVITVDKDQGTTPFMMGCLATPYCDGTMSSSFYMGPLVNSPKEATYEWRKPTPAEYAVAMPALKDHFDMGGLDIHPIKEGK